eukprot:m.356968 g.356968  ORF g.356968 m.356968 type:complete len:141 (-) comp17675_c0_seq1:312-734(-)
MSGATKLRHVISTLRTGKVTGSSYIQGVMPVLQQLIRFDQLKLSKVIPARAHPVSGSHSKRFRMRILGEEPNGYRVIAKRESKIQELFLVTPVDQKVLQYCLDEAMGLNHIARLQGFELPSGMTDEEFASLDDTNAASKE